jgi:hypothetical protein
VLKITVSSGEYGLKRLYELHSKSEWVDWDNFHDLGLPQQEVGRYLEHLNYG